MAVLIKTRRDGGASYASISVVAPVLASSRFRENPRSFGPFLSPRPLLFFFGSLCETFEFLQPRGKSPSSSAYRRHQTRGKYLPTIVGSTHFRFYLPRRLARSWITGFSRFLRFYLYFFHRVVFIPSFRRVRDLVPSYRFSNCERE